MNKHVFALLPIVVLFLHPNFAYANSGFTVKYYNQQPENNKVLAQVSNQANPRSSTPEVIILSNRDQNQANPSEVQHENNNETQPFSWMSKVGRMGQQYHNDVEAIISQIKVEKQAKTYNNVQVQTVSFNSGNFSNQSKSSNRDNYDQIISYLSNKYGVSAGVIKAVMHTESSFNPNARSPVGAQGLMQLMPATARRFNVSNAYDPQQNIEGGVKYLGWLLKRFDGNLTLALAGYNAGEGNVDKYGGIPPFRETKDYVRRVLTRYHSLYRGL